MTTFLLLFLLAAVSAFAVVGLVRAVHDDRPRRAPRGPSYWAGTGLPSGPFATR